MRILRHTLKSGRSSSERGSWHLSVLILALTPVLSALGCSDDETPSDTGTDAADSGGDAVGDAVDDGDAVGDVEADGDVTADVEADLSDDTPVDTTPPTVTENAPADGDTRKPDSISISVTFDELMDESTVNDTSFLVEDSSDAAVSGTVVYSARTAFFTPSATLADDTYTATVTTDVTDVAGNALEAEFSWSFTTDGTAPTVDSFTPADSATVGLDTVVTATFSEAIDESTLEDNFTLTLSGAGGSVVGVYTYDNTSFTATITPSADLTADTYVVTLAMGITDLVGNGLDDAVTWSFTAE